MNGDSQIKNIYPATPMQAGMIFHSMYQPDSDAYFQQLDFVLSGNLNVTLLEKSFNTLIERHDVLRTIFNVKKRGEPLQIVLKSRKLKIHAEDISGRSRGWQSRFLKQYKANDKNKGFNLFKDLLLRVSVIHLGESEHRLIWSHHHILMDGWCMGTVVNELLSIYQALLVGAEPDLEPSVPFHRYVKWLEGRDDESAKRFWTTQLSDYAQVSGIPANQKNISKEIKRLEKMSFAIPEKTVMRLEQMAKNNQVTLQIVFQALWGILLQRYNGVSDVVFGNVVSGRPYEIDGIDRMIGLFINTVPVRVQTGAETSWAELIHTLQRNYLTSQEFQYYPLYEVQNLSPLKQNLLNHILLFENFSIIKQVNEESNHQLGFQIVKVQAFEQTNYDFMVSVTVDGSMTIKFSYNKQHYSKVMLEQVKGQLLQLVEQILQTPDGPLSEISVIPLLEQDKLLNGYNQTDIEYDKHKTLNDLWAEHGQAENLAITDGYRSYTYLELDRQSNRLAAYLRKRGVKPDMPVGLMVKRSVDMLVGMLGILKSGGAYLPVDPLYPAERISYILNDSKAKFMLSEAESGTGFPFAGEIITFEEQPWRDEDPSVPELVSTPNDLAYVTYTSGSTGLPKGVAVEHRSVINFFKGMDQLFLLNSETPVLALTSMSFDIHVTELLYPITKGSKIVLADEMSALETKRLCSLMEKEQVRVIQTTPSRLKVLLQEHDFEKTLASLQVILVGGEAFPAHLLHKIKACTDAVIWNMYGPSETTVWSTAYRMDDCEIVTIGKPIANTKVYILNEKQALVPIGVPGELYIAGSGLARGYLNRPELTEERFVPNPFEPGNLMYRTGDLVKWSEDGNIEYIGRNDKQVKVRGHRIEIREVEIQLLRINGIKDVSVISRDIQGEGTLCAFGVTDREISVNEVKEILVKVLPSYMVPSYFVNLVQLPVTPNGKVDQQALQTWPLSVNSLLREDEQPQGEAEAKLSEMWKSLLELQTVGRFDHFFERGGHSLKAIGLIAKIRNVFQIDISVKDVFEYPILHQLAQRITQAKQKAWSAILPAPLMEYYPVTSAQKRLYILNQLEGISTAYNMPIAIRANGAMDIQQLEHSLLELVKRHEMLRTSFQTWDEEIVQVISESSSFKLEVSSSQDDIPALLEKFIQPFDLSSGNLFRARLVCRQDQEYIILFDMHHIISDAASVRILTKELMDLYHAHNLQPLPVQYKDYSVWQHSIEQQRKLETQENYWRTVFSEEIASLALPTEFLRPPVQRYLGEHINFQLDGEISEQINHFISLNNVTPYMFFLSVYYILLWKYTGQKDIVIGTPVSGRTHESLEHVIGMFINTLALRNKPEGEKTFEWFLQEIKTSLLDAFDNQDFPFEKLVEQLMLARDLSRNPLFDTMFIFHQPEKIGAVERFSQLDFQPVEVELKKTKFDLTFSVTPTSNGYNITMEYCTDLFSKEYIQRMYFHYIRILQSVIERPGDRLKQLSLLTETDKKQLDSFQGFGFDNNSLPDTTVHRLFEEQVGRTPDQIAVVHANEELTYSELNKRANQLAWRLRKLGLQPDEVVAVKAGRSVAQITGVLAVMKSGGCFLPVDPGYPEDRIKYMLDNASVRFIMTDQPEEMKEGSGYTLLHLSDWDQWEGPDDNLDAGSLHQLLYMIYTSGTTGNPKGAMLEHRTIVNLVTHMQKHTAVYHNTNVLQYASVNFDVCYQEIFTTLLSGGKLFVVPEDTKRNIDKLFAFINLNQIEIFYIPTALLKSLFNDHEFVSLFPGCIKHLITAGEQLIVTQYLKEVLKSNGVCLHNHYGPTEAHAVTIAQYEPSEADEIPSLPPIGRPIHHTEILILDSYGHQQPLLVAGELHISGPGVGRGYAGQQLGGGFIPYPGKKDQIMYRTGDLARWLPDGNIEYLGRIDHQVKIRGFRVELGEVEAHLLQAPEVIQAAVKVFDASANTKIICAYLVSAEPIDSIRLRKYFTTKLPDYMIPTWFIQMDSIPLTRNGKVNHHLLPHPSTVISPNNDDAEASMSATEKAVHALWRKTLNVDKLGGKDHFFEMGGNSLTAMLLLSRISQSLHVNVPLRQLFLGPTVRELAQYIDGLEKKEKADLPMLQADYRGDYPLSASQRRLYVLNQIQANETAYNLPGAIVLEGPLDLVRLELALRALVQRHEILRTSFYMRGDEAVQCIHQDVAVELVCIQVDEEAVDDELRQFVQPFRLDSAPLLRVGLFQLGDHRYVLAYDMHHIISDGMSMGIFVNELAALYRNESLPELQFQYKDYACWQQEFLKSAFMMQQEKYWTSVFDNRIPILDLPTDYPRPAYKSFEGDHVFHSLDSLQYTRLKEFALKANTTVYTVLLAVYSIMLSKYSGQEEVIVGSPVSGRNRPETEPLLGVFINTLAMKTRVVREVPFVQLLESVKENTLAALENQDYPFELLVEKLQLERDVSRNPLFDVLFVMQNMEQEKAVLPELTSRPWPFNNHVAKFDLTLTVFDTGHGLDLSLSYSKDLFHSSTVLQMLNHLIQLIDDCQLYPYKKIAEMEMLSKQEKADLSLHSYGKEREYPLNRTLHAIFEEQAALWPNRLAVVMEDREITYKNLDLWSSKLACKLIAFGCKPGDIVAVAAGRSIESVAAIIAVLKAGCAYLPVDMELPPGRIEYMLELSETGVFIADASFSSSLKFNGEIISFEASGDFGVSAESLTERRNISASELAYVIFTSGTTGLPKGVMIEHRTVVNFTYGFFEQINGFAEKYINFAQMAPFYFDASIKPLFGSLLFGKTMHLVSEETRGRGDRLVRFFNESEIHISDITPTLVKSMTAVADRCRLQVPCLLIGGEKLTRHAVMDLIDMCTEDEPNYYNVYGPTETCVNSTLYPISNLEDRASHQSLPIGKPLPNQRAYILSKNMEIVPIGVIGELFIGGLGLARGYLQNQELTDKNFVADPFCPSERMYRTGDLVKWLPDGSIEYLGRADHQVKIRGTRIELYEIERWLKEFPGIEDAIVIDRMDSSGETYLCAYIVSGSVFAEQEIKEHLMNYVPLYMLPSYYIRLDQIPALRNGKVNRKALPEPVAVDEAENMGGLPKNELQASLMRIWLEVLPVEVLGIRDDFFRKGGNSLKAAVLASIIFRELGVEVPLRQIFLSPTIHDMSKFIGAQKIVPWMTIQKADEMSYYPVSSSQRRLYFLQQLEPAGMTYNMPFIVKVNGPLHLTRLEFAVNQLVRRHEILRTSFIIEGGEPVQLVQDAKPYRLECDTAESWEELWSRTSAYIKPFSLGEAPLFRIRLILLSNEEYALLWDMHHIISDGLSNRVYLNELVQIYLGATLEEPELQYKDYTVWQKAQLQSAHYEQMEKYWLEMFAEPHEALSLPLDFERPLRQSFSGDAVHFSLAEKETAQLHKLAEETGCSVYMILLSGLFIFLAKYSGQSDIVVGSPIAGRTRIEWQDLGGVFVNTLALRAYPKKHKGLQEFLAEVKDMMLDAYDNQEYPFDSLIDKLNLPRDLSRNPIFDVMFVLQNMDNVKIDLTGLQAEMMEPPTISAKHDLKLNAVERNGQYYFAFEYCSDLFTKETVRRMNTHFLHVLCQIINDPGLSIADVQLITECETSRLVAAAQDYTKIAYIAALDRFRESVTRFDYAISVIDQGAQISYADFDILTDQMANTLREQYSINPNDVVVVMLEKSVNSMAAIWALFKLGAIYLPVDPNYPRDRIQYILKDSSAKLVITSEEYSEMISETTLIADVDQMLARQTACSTFIPHISLAEDLAYLIYTSGSTGNPKGVAVSHGNLSHFCNAINELLKTEAPDVIVSASSTSFDMSILELIWPLTKGMAVVLHRGKDSNYDKYLEVLQNRTVAFQTTPSRMKLILGDPLSRTFLKSLSVLLVGGEMLPPVLLDQIFERTDGGIYHMYGPTEATVWSTGCLLNKGDSIHIGRPLADVGVCLLDESMHIVPPGVIGEIYIGGAGVAQGYWNNKQQTDEHFINLTIKGSDEELFYRTGDFARYTTNGNIDFLGRRDQQFKVRGYRIEINEVETCLMRHPQIDQAAVLKVENAFGDGELIAYYSSADPELYEFAHFHMFMRQHLPEYALPSRYIRLSEWPITPNGKMDRKKLLQLMPDQLFLERNLTPPRTETEKKLAALWNSLLGTAEIDVTSHFFELGGHSLKAAVLVNEIYKVFNIELPYDFVFKYPTIAEMGRILDAISSDLREMINPYTFYNEAQEKMLFCFPPIAGLGSIYGNLAKQITGYKICGFDFIDQGDIIQTYVDLILQFQPVGPYILIGYSAGGNLAYEVAKVLEAEGREVSNIILFDSVYKDNVKYRDYGEMLRETEIQVNLLIEEVQQTSKAVKINDAEQLVLIKRKFINNVMKYKEFYNQLQNHPEPALSYIHVIHSDTVQQFNERPEWNNHSLRGSQILQGFGEHSAMLSEFYAYQNAQVLNSILDQLSLSKPN